MLMSKFQDILGCFPEYSFKASVLEATHPQIPAGAPMVSSLALSKGSYSEWAWPCVVSPSVSDFVPEGKSISWLTG